MTLDRRPVFPFTALVGQERMKRALILNTVNPRLGGVLIRGEKGTAKSTAVRALANLLPEIVAVADCPYSCDPRDLGSACESCRRLTNPPTLSRRVPLVELPVGATEDRVVGTLDLEQAIQEGRRRFEPGLLASANRGILYIDEVNLLNDHLVDVLLDAAAMGVNYVQREGISIEHPSQFILVGTMNPEEGDLRPQLLDRFALAVEVEGLSDPGARTEVVRRRIAFEKEPASFVADSGEAEMAERQRIARAQRLLPEVHLDERMLRLISQLCVDFEVDGMRADIVMYKTAMTLAAYAGRKLVNEADVRDAAEMALLHRRRRLPFQQPQLDREQLEDRIRERLAESEAGEQGRDGGDNDHSDEDPQLEPPPESPGSQQVFGSGKDYAVKPLSAPAGKKLRQDYRGRRSKALSRTFSGHYVGASIPRQQVSDIALDATLRVAAPNQRRRRAVREAQKASESGSQPHSPKLLLERSDLREKIRETKMGNLIMFVVDASGSMAARDRMVAAKGAVLSLLLDAYQKRDRVGLIAFRGAGAELLLSPTNSVDLAEACLTALPTGGRTPLGHGVQLAVSSVDRHLSQSRDVLPLVILVSDGRTNVSLNGGDPRLELQQLGQELRRRKVHTLVVDAEESKVRLGFAAEVAQSLSAEYLPIGELQASTLARAARQAADTSWRHWGKG